MPAIALNRGIWIWIGIIAVIKVINIISGFVVQKRFVSVHSPANKITGIVLFLLPLTLSFIGISYSAIFVCLFATFTTYSKDKYKVGDGIEICYNIHNPEHYRMKGKCKSLLFGLGLAAVGVVLTVLYFI